MPTLTAADAIPALYQVRSYDAQKGDWKLVSGWWKAHGTDCGISEAILPPTGIIVECSGNPVSALWAHLSAGIGVAFLEYPVSRPGLGFVKAAEAMDVALNAIEAICRSLDYGLLVANTLPAIARWLERRKGFQRAGERVQLFKLISKHGS